MFELDHSKTKKPNNKSNNLEKSIVYKDMKNEQFENEKLCQICCERNYEEDIFYCRFHKTCLVCIGYYIKTRVKNGFFGRSDENISINCIFYDCRCVEYDGNLLGKFMDKEDKKLFGKFKMWRYKYNLIKNDRYYECTYPDCDEYVKIENLRLGNSIHKILGHCANDHLFCIKCKISCKRSNTLSMNEFIRRSECLEVSQILLINFKFHN